MELIIAHEGLTPKQKHMDIKSHQEHNFLLEDSSNKPPNKEVICIIWNLTKTLLILLHYTTIFYYNFMVCILVKLLHLFLHYPCISFYYPCMYFYTIHVCLFTLFITAHIHCYYANSIFNVAIDRLGKNYVKIG